MLNYIGVKMVKAMPMDVNEMNIKYPDIKTSTEEQDGYLVIYPDGYKSWSPKSVFQESYRPVVGMNFGIALEVLKKGKRVARIGWNGKNMWLQAQFPDEYSKMQHPYIFMKGADGKYFPWNPNNLDMFAEDWTIVD